MNERIGRVVIWLTLFMVLIGAYNAVARYLTQYTDLQLTSNLFFELQWYLFSLIFLFLGAYALKHNAHVRVDVAFASFSPRTQTWINFLGSVLFLIPFCAAMIWFSIPAVRSSWVVMEVSPDPGGLPRYPIKTVIPVAFLLLLLQGFSEAVKYLAILKGSKPQSPPRQDDVMPLEGV